jgi:uncharacterized protein (DUF3084 family)
MTSRWFTLGAAVALAGCAGLGGSKNNESTSQTSKVQSQAASAFQRAADAQKQANDEQAKAEKAQEEVTAAQKALADAQARAQGQQAKAQQAQQHARELAQQAQSEGQTSQQQALQIQQSEATQRQTLHQENQKAWTQTRDVNGKVFQASRDTLKVRAGDQDMSLKLSDSTAITVDGKPSSPRDIQPGSDVRASYQMVDGQATALKVDVTSSQGSSNPSGMNSSSGSSTSGSDQR